MSDLQCAARLFVACPVDGDDGDLLASTLESARIAAVWSSPLTRPTAEGAAVHLGAPVVVREELAEPDPGAGADPVAVRGLLEEVADSYRGESVLLLTREDVVRRVIPLLAVNLGIERARTAPLPPGGIVELDGDADGWIARSWAGEPL